MYFSIRFARMQRYVQMRVVSTELIADVSLFCKIGSRGRMYMKKKQGAKNRSVRNGASRSRHGRMMQDQYTKRSESDQTDMSEIQDKDPRCRRQSQVERKE